MPTSTAFTSTYLFLLTGNPMKNTKTFAAFIAATSLSLLVGCAATPSQEGTGQYIDDTVITTKVKTAIFNEPSLKSMEINVETFKGRVQLSGFVSTQSNANKAMDLARGVGGVLAVKDDMRLK
jgi:osmotically-inducible protein OsmY